MPDITTIGVISDIHSNIVALHAVMADMPPVDMTVCAGDIVGYNPWPVECVEYIQQNDVISVQGNHDRVTVTGEYGWFNRLGRAGIDHAREKLSEDHMSWLESLPPSQLLVDGRVKLVHSHPDKLDHYTYPDEFSETLMGTEDVLIMGHTHVQHVAEFDTGLVLNSGSIGQPRDGDPRAAYAVVDLEEMTAETRRTEYAVTRVQSAIEKAGLPSASATRLEQGE